MADSLQDQLRALGLAKREPARKRGVKNRGPQRGRRREAAQEKRAPGKTGSPDEMALDKAYALRQRDEQKQADRARRKKQAEDRQRREINQKIRAVVEAHRLNDEKAERARHFLFRGRIRKIYVTEEQHKALGEGKLGIVYLSGGYHLLAPATLEVVRNISPDHLVDLGSDSAEEIDHPVPDDLDW